VTILTKKQYENVGKRLYHIRRELERAEAQFASLSGEERPPNPNKDLAQGKESMKSASRRLAELIDEFTSAEASAHLLTGDGG